MDDRLERLERCRELAVSYETFGANDQVLARLHANARISECYGGPAPDNIFDYQRKETREERMLRLWDVHTPRARHVRD
jgi:hypothetical protein